MTNTEALQSRASELLQSAHLRAMHYPMQHAVRMRQLLESRQRLSALPMDSFMWWREQVQSQFRNIDPELCQSLAEFDLNWKLHVSATAQRFRSEDW